MVNLYRTFTVQTLSPTVDQRGRPLSQTWTTRTTLTAILAGQRSNQVIVNGQVQHPTSWQIAQKGPAVARPRERLLLGDRPFYVTNIDNPGDLGLWTIYHCTERQDDAA